MKKITFKTILIVALIPLFLFSVKAKATETVNDILVSYGENILYLNDKVCKFENGTLSSIKNVYYSCINKNRSIAIVIPTEAIDAKPKATLIYYDINFVECGSQTFSESEFNMFDLGDRFVAASSPIPEETFSISYEISGLRKSFEIEDLKVEILDSESYDYYSRLYYVDYIPTRGFIDLCQTPNVTLEKSYKTPYKEEEINAMVECIDACNGNSKNKIKIDSSNYSKNCSKLGTYAINISFVEDEANTPIASFYIEVIDDVLPSIDGPEEITIEVFDIITKETLEDEGFEFIDEYDDSNKIKTTLIITNSLESTDEINEGLLNLKLIDSSGNITTKDVVLKIVDNTPPTIDVIKNHISVPYNYKFGIDGIVSASFVFNDNYSIDLDISYEEDNYTPNRRNPGEYEVIVVCKDESLNESKETLYIKVYDDVPPVIFLNTYKIDIDITIKLTVDDLILKLIELGELESIENYDIDILCNTYIGNEDRPGEYLFQAKFLSKTGDISVKTLEIFVKNIETITKEKEEVITPTKETNYLKIGLSFIAFGSCVCLFGRTVTKIKKKK